jgi:hypothetical protein
MPKKFVEAWSDTCKQFIDDMGKIGKDEDENEDEGED